jgi:predicted transcriptional regulator
MNTTKFIRSKRDIDNPFTHISNSIANLKADEAGIMLQILSNADSWVINKDVVLKRSKLGKTRFTKAWNHLKELGHITLKKLPIENGKFCYQYTIYEIPEVQNPSKVIDKPYTDYRTTVSRTTVTGGTNNNYITNNEEETTGTSVSNSRNRCEVRHQHKIKGPILLGQKEINKNDSQIVPHPQLCFGSVRDNDTAQKEDPSIISPTQAPINTIPSIPVNSGSEPAEDQNPSFSSEVCYSRKNYISPQTQEILDDLENIPNEDLIVMINIYYEEDIPNWGNLLKEKPLQGFLKGTSKLVKPDIPTIEILTEYKNRLKKEAYKKH